MFQKIKIMLQYIFSVSISCILLMNNSANACVVFHPLKFEDVLNANAVVVGRILNYEVVKSEFARQQTQEILENNSNMKEPSLQIYEILRKQTSFLSGYARFEIEVDEVLLGNVEEVLQVTSKSNAIREVAGISDDQYLIALRNSNIPLSPLSGLSATTLPSHETQKMTVLHAPCSSAFILKKEDRRAKEVRKILQTKN